MKKYLLLFSFLFAVLAVNAQSFSDLLKNNKSSTSSYSSKYSDNKEIVVPTQLTKSAMWINLKKWVSSTFKSYKYVVDLEDKESGVLILKWNANIPNATISDCVIATAEGTFQVDVRDNKYRIRKSDEYISVRAANMNAKRMPNAILKTALEELEIITGVFKSERMSIDDLKNESATLISSMRYKYLELSNELVNSLKKQMIYVDDF